MKRLLFMMWEAGAALHKWRGDVEGAAGVSACVKWRGMQLSPLLLNDCCVSKDLPSPDMP